MLSSSMETIPLFALNGQKQEEKGILHSYVLDDHDHDKSYVLALHAPKSAPLASSSPSFLSPVSPPSIYDVDPVVPTPTPEVVPGPLEAIPNPLEVVTVEDCSNDDPLVAALLKEEQLDFSFSNDDSEDMFHSSPLSPPSSGYIPPSSSRGWTTVKPRRKANKHICNTPKGKEVITANVETIVNLRT
ncbi:hypothetical protein NC652_002107 [Populus alba x Populus x berolinensis]|nr:hypothetical protein NC652_002107 [Populus alba x Populus x berolinensis]